MADLGQGWKSPQTLWNASYMLANAFLVALGTVCVEFGWILKGPKLAVFEQKPWARLFESRLSANLGLNLSNPRLNFNRRLVLLFKARLALTSG